MNHQEKSERDELRARFTGWLEVTLYRAKLNYVKRLEREKGIVYVDAFPEELWVSENPERNWIQGITEPGAFQFEEERLEKAFHTLSEQRREILAMLFVEERTPKEIASQMGCSLQHVYKHRSQALKQLRQMLEKGGEENE